MRALLPVLALALVATTAPACATDTVAPGTPGAEQPSEPAGSTPSSSPSSATPSASSSASATRQRARLPRLGVRRVVTGLDNPWDVQRLPSGRLLVTERDRGRLSTFHGNRRRTVRFPSNRIWVSGETGLMSMEIDPRFRKNRRFYVCSGWQKQGGGHDIRITAWRLRTGARRARRVDTLLAGLPTSSGRHGGCRLLIARDGSLLVGTGDAAVSSNPQDLTSLGGKTLRLNRMTGKPWPGNPFPGANSRRKRFVHSYGHRNVQGLAQRRNGSLWSVEHGPTRDDEVNLLRKGGNYGWDPGPGYDESVPMTDRGLPGRQIGARWRSGTPTLATSGAAWVYGKKWGRLNGTLAVAALKASRVVFMRFGKGGRLKWTRAPRRLRRLGRLRSVTLTPGRNLLLTTDNDGGSDAVVRVRPRRRS